MTIARTGVAELRLCEGYVPQYKEMVELAYPILKLIIDEYGIKHTIKRFSDPFWFQSLATALGFEHNYTGATTVTIKAIKESLKNNEPLGIEVVGGKGKEALNVVNEVDNNIAYISRLVTKSDNILLQDSYDLYFHTIIIDENMRTYTIINQGMNTNEQLVRRYHWYNPQDYRSKEVYTKTTNISLNIKEQKELHKIMVDVVKDYSPKNIKKKILLLRRSYEAFKKGNKTLLPRDELKFFKSISVMPYYLYFPKNLDIKALEVAEKASKFKELLSIKGMGKSTIRGLAYLSAIIYGEEIKWDNPQQYCYTFGTKAGKPWYVERDAMKKAASILREIAEGLDVEAQKKKEVLKRLSKLI